MAHDVFISYSHHDKAAAEAVCAKLEQHQVRCWIAPRDVVPGAEWAGAIIRAINESRVMVLVFSSNANRSPQIHKEVERAVNKGVIVVPLRIEDVAPSESLEFFMSNVHWLDALTPPLEQHLDYLAGTVKMRLEQTSKEEPAHHHEFGEGHAAKPSNVTSRRERALDAGMPRRVPVGRATQVVAMVRETNSRGLKRVLRIEEDHLVAPEEVRSKGIEIEFPLDAHGDPQPIEFTLRLEAPDFEPRSQSKNLFVPVKGDSEICSFLLTAQRAGELLLHLEVLHGAANVVKRSFKTTAHADVMGASAIGSVLVSVPLYTYASTSAASPPPQNLTVPRISEAARAMPTIDDNPAPATARIPGPASPLPSTQAAIPAQFPSPGLENPAARSRSSRDTLGGASNESERPTRRVWLRATLGGATGLIILLGVLFFATWNGKQPSITESAGRGLEAMPPSTTLADFLLSLPFIGLALYVYLALTLLSIARKTNTPHAWWAWVPILNILLVLNIAERPLWWVLLFLIPVVNIVILIVVGIEVARACGKPSWLGVLCVIPIIQLFALGYLAWAD